MRNRLGDDDRCRCDDNRLNSRAATLLIAAFFAFASLIIRRRTIVVVRPSRGVLMWFGSVVMMLGIVRLTVFMRSHSLVGVRRFGVTRPGAVVPSTGAEAFYVA